ncbi:uncharacterized protein LOC125827456 [Solanum verrucosum]|uniref:uncharacterized protein LOC125827456 n=1 Tax=Solanum verrucosum TaxID=315347 RepID=UPI0020D175DA|nr:uncharacterized protein LOC125827456 [Solanum verrucosum]
MRNDDEDEILHTGRLFKQYSVDDYIKLESQRLDFASFNEDLFRMDVLQGLLDILRLGERDASNVGKRSFLPSWPETKEHRYATDETQSRPDLISRIFRSKVEELKIDITKRNLCALKYGGAQYLDNSLVVSYNPFLPDKFNCHMNVEVCSDIKVVKYLYKYICKGHDKIAFCVQDSDTNRKIDEIKEFQSARWVSPPESAWRLFGFSISEMSLSISHLQLHLEGQQFVSFRNDTDIHTIVNNPMI